MLLNIVVCTAADCTHVAVGDTQGLVSGWDLIHGTMLGAAAAHDGPCNDCHWGGNQNSLISCGHDGYLSQLMVSDAAAMAMTLSLLAASRFWLIFTCGSRHSYAIRSRVKVIHFERMGTPQCPWQEHCQYVFYSANTQHAYGCILSSALQTWSPLSQWIMLTRPCHIDCLQLEPEAMNTYIQAFKALYHSSSKRNKVRGWGGSGDAVH